MKIKRFEAASMSGALKMIKQEFGDEAVILSAKSYKKSTGLISSKRSAKVVVTAAVDPPSASAKRRSKQQPNSSQATHEERSGAHPQGRGKLEFLKQFNPITRTGQQKLQSKFMGKIKDSRNEEIGKTVYRYLVDQGVNNTIAEDMNNQVASLIHPGIDDPDETRSALSHVIQAQQIVERSPSADPSTPRIVVLVGPSGSGKTTMAAKLATMQVRQTPGSAAFLSLDDRRVAGCAELERYADILGVRLEKTNESDNLTRVIDELSQHHQLIVVDTPGLAMEDKELRDHLRRMITAIPNAEVHLLLNADSQNGTLKRAISYFAPVGAQFLGFTRLDWADTLGSLINMATDFDLPITYLSDTVKVNKGTKLATAEMLTDLLLVHASLLSKTRSDIHGAVTAQADITVSKSMNYVANRNSDIFHKSDCQSVKRINNENIVAFNDPAEAMGRHFKPCRMCCGELLISKPIQRVAYKYASSR